MRTCRADTLFGPWFAYEDYRLLSFSTFVLIIENYIHCIYKLLYIYTQLIHNNHVQSWSRAFLGLYHLYENLIRIDGHSNQLVSSNVCCNSTYANSKLEQKQISKEVSFSLEVYSFKSKPTHSKLRLYTYLDLFTVIYQLESESSMNLSYMKWMPSIAENYLSVPVDESESIELIKNWN